MFKVVNHFKYILIFVLSVYISISEVDAATIQAASCSFSDVQTAITSAAIGDTVNVPAGSCTWSNAIIITKGMDIVGAGKANTQITSTFAAFRIELAVDNRIEISHIGFYGTGGVSRGIAITGNDNGVHEEQVVIHDSHFENHDQSIYVDYDGAHGVVYDSTFVTSGGKAARFGGYLNGIGNHTNTPWAWDSEHSFVFEDVTFSGTGPIFISTEFPFTYTVRHSTVTRASGQMFEMHGGGSVTNLGPIVHDNTITYDSNSQFIEIRGGQYNLVYNNTKGGAGTPSVRLDADCSSQCNPTFDTYVWNNTGHTVSATSGNIEGVNYFLFQPGNFAELTYPHPLRDTLAPAAPTSLSVQ